MLLLEYDLCCVRIIALYSRHCDSDDSNKNAHLLAHKHTMIAHGKHANFFPVACFTRSNHSYGLSVILSSLFHLRHSHKFQFQNKRTFLILFLTLDYYSHVVQYQILMDMVHKYIGSYFIIILL